MVLKDSKFTSSVSQIQIKYLLRNLRNQLKHQTISTEIPILFLDVLVIIKQSRSASPEENWQLYLPCRNSHVPPQLYETMALRINLAKSLTVLPHFEGVKRLRAARALLKYNGDFEISIHLHIMFSLKAEPPRYLVREH